MVAIDLDGTLVDKNNHIAIEDKQAITRLVNSSVTVALCTERVVQSAMPVVEELGIRTYHMFYDGAFIANPHTKFELYSQAIEATLLQEVVDFCRQHNIHLGLYANGGDFSGGNPLGEHWAAAITTDFLYTEHPNWSDVIHRDFLNIEPTRVNFDDIVGKKSICKAELMVNCDEEAIQAKQLKDYFGDRLHYSMAYSPALSDIDFINILHPYVSRGDALMKLMECWGIAPPEVVAIGDGLNDISLLKTAGISVAMGNACSDLKQIASYITNPIEEHGVAKAINFFFPV